MVFARGDLSLWWFRVDQRINFSNQERKAWVGEMTRQIPHHKSTIKVCIVKAYQLWTNKSDCNSRGTLCV